MQTSRRGEFSPDVSEPRANRSNSGNASDTPAAPNNRRRSRFIRTLPSVYEPCSVPSPHRSHSAQSPVRTVPSRHRSQPSQSPDHTVTSPFHSQDLDSASRPMLLASKSFALHHLVDQGSQSVVASANALDNPPDIGSVRQRRLSARGVRQQPFGDRPCDLVFILQ